MTTVLLLAILASLALVGIAFVAHSASRENPYVTVPVTVLAFFLIVAIVGTIGAETRRVNAVCVDPSAFQQNGASFSGLQR